MCIAYLALRSHPDWPLFIAANRDEFHDRPTQAAAPWAKHADVIAGIDLLAGGTWLGINRQGRFGLLTNYREMGTHRPDAQSRGELVGNFLTGTDRPQAYEQQVAMNGHVYNGFNLIVGDLQQACYIANQPHIRSHELAAGRYVISNHLLDTAWPKAERLRAALSYYPSDELLSSLSPIFAILKDTTQAPDEHLPSTGLDLDRERLLSSPFIISPGYGTRCSTVIAVHRSGQGIFSEITYNPEGIGSERHDWPFQISEALSHYPQV